MTDKRFPRSVYGIGDEPDPRFSLANERTFLAWVRTALALLAVGVAIEAFGSGISPVFRFVAGLMFIVLAAAAVVHAWLSWRRTERALRLNRALPGLTFGALIGAGVVIAMLVVVAGLLW